MIICSRVFFGLLQMLNYCSRPIPITYPQLQSQLIDHRGSNVRLGEPIQGMRLSACVLWRWHYTIGESLSL